MDVAQLIRCHHAASSILLLWIGQAILFGTVLAGLTAIVTRLPRLRIKPSVETCLWLIVLIKFLMPVGPAWSYSLSSLYRLFSSDETPSAKVNTPTIFHTPDLSTTIMARNNQEASSAGSYDLRAQEVAFPTRLDQPATVTGTTMPKWHWTFVVSDIYLLCIFSLFVIRVRSYRRLVARCHALAHASESIRHLAMNVCQKMGVRRLPVIHISHEASAPFVMGFAHPHLVLPRHLLVRPDELETVIVHEIAHLRRSDMLVRYLQWVAGTLLFCWPVVAWVNRHLDMARESACDTWALRYGKLSAHEYARCLLRVAQPARPIRFAYSPCHMAAHPKTIERRIDMILQSPHVSSHRRAWGLSTLALLVIWGGFTLTGADTNLAPVDTPIWPLTEEAIHQRASDVYYLVTEHGAADINGDGNLSYLEKDTYLVALAIRNAESFMEEFPYADRNHSSHLDILEANGVIRAITLIAYADRRASASTEHSLPLEFCHAALDAQIWLLDNQTETPTAGELDQIWSVLCRVRGSANSYSARMFDHGGPELPNSLIKVQSERSQFQELENNMAVLKARLMASQDRDEIDRLRTMLSKLETVLSRLQAS